MIMNGLSVKAIWWTTDAVAIQSDITLRGVFLKKGRGRVGKYPDWTA